MTAVHSLLDLSMPEWAAVALAVIEAHLLQTLVLARSQVLSSPALLLVLEVALLLAGPTDGSACAAVHATALQDLGHRKVAAPQATAYNSACAVLH